MEIGIAAPKCKCVHGCEKGVEPMSDCICKLAGDVRTARCEIEGGTTWHVNGSCLSCVRRSAAERKERMAKRHEEIMAAPPHPIDLTQVMEEAEIVEQPLLVSPAGQPLVRPVTGPAPSGLAIVLRVGGAEFVLTCDPAKVERAIQAVTL